MDPARDDGLGATAGAVAPSGASPWWVRERGPAAHTAAIFVVALMVEFAVRAVARVPLTRLGDGSLVVAAIRSNVPFVLAGVVGIVLVARFGRRGLGLRWTDLEHGATLRVVAALTVGLLVWRYATLPHDLVFDQWRFLDRALLVLCAGVALWRPLGVVPTLVLVRVMMQPLLGVLDSSSGLNIERVLLLVGALLVATVLIAVVTGESRTSPLVVLLVALVAAQFFVPGRAKLGIGWLGLNDLGNMAPNGYAQGWLGAGDGEFAGRLADAMDAFAPVLGVATITLELGALLAVLHRRVAIGWLVAAVGFHTAVAAAYGFSFLEWLVLELVLVVVLLRRPLRPWVAEAFRPGGVAVAVLVVLSATAVLRPPHLAWIDGPVTYRYDIDGTDVEGRTWAVEPEAFAPYDTPFAFGMVPLGPSTPVAAGYGATAAPQARALREVDTFEALAELEASLGSGPSEAARDEVVWFLQRFMASTEDGLSPWLPAPPRHFWIDRPEADYDGRSPIVRLEVTRVTTLRTAQGELRRSEAVLTITRDGDRFEVTTPQ